MATGTVVFQTTTATPPAGLAVMADAVNDSDHGAGTAQYIKIMDGATAGTAKAGVTTANGLAVDVTRVQGTVQTLGSIQGVGTFQVLGTVQGHGTFQALGTFQPLAGSVHLASGTVTVVGTVQAHGTTQVLGTVQTVGSIPLVGTGQFLGTMQPLAGSVHVANTAAVLGSVSAQGYSAHDGAMVGNPLLLAGYGSSGTQAASHDGSITRLWTDLNGRLQVRGTIDSLPNVTVTSLPNVTIAGGTVGAAGGTFTVVGTVQTHGTSQVLGSVQTVGTSQVLGTVQTVGSIPLIGTGQFLGTFQPLAGSVHVANTAAILGSVSAQGYVAHDAAAAGNPVLFGAFGTSGTQAAVNDGDAVRLWADLNGRLQVRGTIDSIPNITITGGTVGAAGGTFTVVGTVQTHGTSQVLGSVQTVGTSQVLGSIQTVGTSQVLGSVQAVGTTQTKEVRSTGATTASVAATVGNIILLAANPSRMGAAFFLESGSALYLKLGSNAGTLDYTLQMQPLGYYEVPFEYVGTISGIWQFTGGTVRVTEII